MAKISTYGVIPTPALLTDLVIGTDVNANNETKNFELRQILSLYPSTTTKGQYSSISSQSASAINTATAIDLPNIRFQNGMVATTSSLFTINNSNTYLLNLSLNLTAVGTSTCTVFLKVNGTNVLWASKMTTIAGINNLSLSGAFAFSAGDTIQWFFSVDTITTSLFFISSTGGIPDIPGAKFTLSQI